jgi:hypothetical protein
MPTWIASGGFNGLPTPTHLKNTSLAMRLKYFLFFLPVLLSLNGEAHGSQTCAATISELRVMLGDQTFPLKWEETSMDDGKPMVVSILENNGYLFLEFIKTREGLWAESAGVICKTGKDFETRFTGEQIRMGPAANWVLRSALGNGGKFTLTRIGSEQLRIATSGWSGIFSPRAK